MSVTDKISSSLGRRDGSANKVLADELCGRPNIASVAELVRNISGTAPRVAGDCLEVLEEIGKRKPES